MSEEDDYREYERECAREDEHWLDEQIETAVEAERARCLEIVKQVCSAAVGSESTRAGVYLPEILAEEIERQIRGEK